MDIKIESVEITSKFSNSLSEYKTVFWFNNLTFESDEFYYILF